MKLVLLGPPGAGKGTQAVNVAKAHNVPHISTGDVFRAAAANNTTMGQKAQEYMSAGKLVPDEVVIGVVRERLNDDDCSGGFLLDGFPRTLPQAQALDTMLTEMNTKLDAAVNINLADEVCIKRLSGRRSCPQCKKGYHLEWMPPKTDGQCDDCGVSLDQRKDDQPESIAVRLKQYHAQTAPLIEYYTGAGVLIDIPGDQDVAAVSEAIAAKLDELAGV